MVANQITTGSEETEYNLKVYSNFKDPGTKNSRVFCFCNKEKMTDTKSKRQAEFVRQHTLTEADLRKMIAEKLERARAWHNARLRREVLQENR